MRHKTLSVENENEYSGNGISYCAACDGVFYKDKCVAVVGGGNSAVQEALYLCDICKSVTVIQNLPSLTAENKLCEQLKKRKNVRFLFNSVITEFTGDGERLNGIIAENTDTKITSKLTFDGVFVAIGLEADNSIFKDLINFSYYLRKCNFTIFIYTNLKCTTKHFIVIFFISTVKISNCGIS